MLTPMNALFIGGFSGLLFGYVLGFLMSMAIYRPTSQFGKRER